MAIVVLCCPAANAVEFGKDKIRGSWDTTVSFGGSYRLDDPDPALVGLINGGQAFSVNGDDGNLNFDTGLFSLTPKLTTELGVSFGEHFGFFGRASSFYDFENEKGDHERTELTSAALDRVESRTDLLDYYVRFSFDLGSRPLELRVGDQVVSWGESTFIQGGINSINPVDVTKLRVPGAELREALLPEGLVWANLALTEDTALELFYQYDWDDTEIDPPGSFFATTDFAGDGGSTVFLGFGSSGDVPPFSDPTDPDRPFLGVTRAADVIPDDGGQYGVAFRWFVPALNGTEFGAFYMNYHSRLPVINGRTGTLAGAQSAGIIGAAATPIVTDTLTELGLALADGVISDAELLGAIGAGTTTGVTAGASLGASTGIAGTTGQTFAAVFAATSDALAAQAAAQTAASTAATGFATDAYAQTARYFISFPEDIELFGLSFNTELGGSGIALQGEVSYRPDAPLQVDDVEMLFAALSPINPVFNGTSGIPGEPGASQLNTFTGMDYSTAFETNIPGQIELDVYQYQTTATKIFGPALGADQTLILGEVALTHVPDMPGKDELRLEGPATYTSGNPYHAVGTNPGSAHAGKSAEGSQHFADSSSWGYRVAIRQEFNNAIGPITLLPRISWQHDVNGVSPGPGGNFIEDRKGITLGLAAILRNQWNADMSYTRYYGAGRHNLIGDRDFVSASLKYSF